MPLFMEIIILTMLMVNEHENIVLIDMMNVCRGPALYDVARTYFLLHDNSRIQSQYQAKMGYSVKDIRPYLDVIQLIRNNEMKR